LKNKSVLSAHWQLFLTANSGPIVNKPLGKLEIFKRWGFKMKKGLWISLMVVSLTLLFFSPGGLACQVPATNDAPLFIRLGDYVFDPLAGGEPEMPMDLRLAQDSPEESGYYVVQFRGPILQAWKDALVASGGQILEYVPDYAFLVHLESGVRQTVEQMETVRWVGIYQPAYKLASALVAEEKSEQQTIVIQLFPGEGTETVSTALQGLEGKTLDVSIGERKSYIRAVVPTSSLPTIARLFAVQWIEPWLEPVLANDVARGVMSVSNVWNTHNLYGEGQIVAVCDTGLDVGANDATMSDDFEGRIVSAHALGRPPDDWSDPHGHGTHVAGSVLGSGALSGSVAANHSYASSYAGIAPEAHLVFQSVLDAVGQLGGIPTDLNTLFQQAYDDGARIHSNSWGSRVNGVYDAQSFALDEFVWDHPDMLILVAAGNEGVDADANGVVDLDSMNSPATAKNCISVGASENSRNSGGYNPGGPCATWGACWPADFAANPVRDDSLSDNTSGMAAFSSRGPTDDQRIKPDVVAPGTNILSARSHDPAAGTGWGVFDTDYVYMGGTSMATPLTAGAATLIREYYSNQCLAPSAALIKATLINGAHDIHPGQYGTGATQETPSARPNNVEGWGRVDLENSLFPASPTKWFFFEETDGLATNGNRTLRYVVNDASTPFKATLVWSDYPGSGLVNDLDLTVTAPNQVTHYPNGLGSADVVNNVEVVDISNPPIGVYTVTINGRNIPFGPQPFALVLSGGELAKLFDVLDPTQANPAYAGPHNAPVKMVIKTSKPLDGLSKDEFSATIGGQSANILTLYEGSDSYVLEIFPPTQPANGMYGLTVSVGSDLDTDFCAVQYADTNNVDIDLVIDRSGSMGSEGKMAAAQEAAKQFVDLMHTNDMIGVVSFDNYIETNFSLTTITSPDIQTQAKAAIDLLYDRGNTSIGGGLQRGQEQLATLGNASHPWAIVLLSDGLENTAPMVADVLPDIVASKTVVHTVGLGSDADEPLMQNIASQTGGTYHFAPGPQELAGIYSTIAGAVSGQQVLFAETGTVQSGATDEKNVVVDSTVSEATFSISWSNSGSTIDLTLRRPNGNIVDPSVAATDPNIDFVSGSTYQYYRVKNPAAGVWAMRATGGYIPLAAPQGRESYTAMVAGIAGLTMNVYVDKDTYLTYQPVNVSVTLSDYQAIAGATVTCDVQPPSTFSALLHMLPWIEVNGDLAPDPQVAAELKAQAAVPASTLTLYDDGTHGDGQANDGVYANAFAATGHDGTYKFTAHATGTSNSGEAFARQGGESVYIAPNPAAIRRIYIPVIVKAYNPSPTPTWHPGANIESRAVYGLAVAPANCTTLYAATDAGLYKSTDGGASWTSTGLNSLLAARSLDATAPSFAKAGDEALSATLVSAVTTDPANSQVVYATTWGSGIYKSTDGGASWTPVNAGLGDLWLYAIVADPSSGQVLYAGANSGGVFKSTDGGGSWFAANNGLANLNLRSLAVDPANSQLLYAGTQGGVYKSADGGGWWAATGALGAGDPWAIAVDSTNSQTLYAGLGGSGVYKSTNGGGVWFAVNNGLGSWDLRALILDPSAPQTLYAGTNGAGVYTSTNGGNTWGAMNDSLGNWMVKALCKGTSCGIIHAGTENGAWRYGP
jgi:subtilisin family serine protease